MSNTTWHPDESELTAFADGELSSPNVRRVEGHVASCDECSGRLQEYREFWADYREARRSALPAPPAAWVNLRPALRQKSRQPVPFRVPLKWVAAAAALVIGVFLFQTTTSRTLSAAELLRDAIVAQKRTAVQAGAQQKKRIRVKTRRAQFVRSGMGAEEARLARLFEDARFRWEEPLDPTSFAEWRDGLAHKEDQVRELPGKLYHLTTSTKDSLLEEASITIRAADMHAVETTFRFRGDEYVEVSEAGEEPAPVAPQQTAKNVAPTVATPVPVKPVGPSEELRVVAAIHAIQADLGDPVEIMRDEERGRIVVSALGADPDRQAQLRTAVSSLGNVELRFEQPDAVRGSAALSSERRSAGAPVPPSKPSELQDRLAAQLGGRTTAENFTNHVMDLSESALARAHALRALARRFPPAVEAQFGAADVAMLRKIEDDHTRALAASVRQMNDVIRPVVRSVSTSAAVADFETWQAGAENVLGAAREVDQVLTRALAGNTSGIDPDEALSKLGRAAADLQARVAALRVTVARAR
ncbi:MAG: zf-HC2 domain-containing protein [Bryobacteraceae bacterium]|nr:zf-HC2 domain-containing protein [Bryobacteraceae bacterium]